ncbi:MAG: cob(I)yrinic acid a,c-diamide adenosyltransferase [Candidatus Paceibacterota bacterium]
MVNRGHIYVFTGRGKGKTTAALGVGLRALGADKKVLMIQFLKPGDSSEREVIKKINNFDIKSLGREGFFLPKSKLEKNPELKEKGIEAFKEKDKEIVLEGLEVAKKKSSDYDIIILDEINLALHYDLIEEGKVLNLLDNIGEAHLILTGRYCPDSIINKADLVTKTEEIKHYYNKGHKPIKGIDL